MSRRQRVTVFLAGAAGLAAILGWGLVGLPTPGALTDLVGDYYLEFAVDQRTLYNVVSAVIFDYRGLDTMGEQLILFASVTALTLLLREQRREDQDEARESAAWRDEPPASGGLTAAGVALTGFAVFIGVYVLLHVQITPGGGFQSGVLVATGFLMLFVTESFPAFERIAPVSVLERIEAATACGYVVVGLVGLGVAGTFLFNFLPLGELGGLLSSGTIALLNLIVGIEVTAGFVLVYFEFLEQTIRVREQAGG